MEVIIAFTGHTNIEKCCGLPVPENGNVYDKSAYDRVYNDISMFMEKLSKLKNIPLNNGIFFYIFVVVFICFKIDREEVMSVLL